MENANGRQPAGTPPPPLVLEPGVYCRIVWARVNDPVRMIALSDAVYGRDLHWMGSVSALCAGRPDCTLCLSEVKKRWYGWVVGHCMLTAEVVIAQIPLESYRRCRAIQDGGLTGRIITMERPGSARSRITIAVSPTRTMCLAGVVPADKIGEYLVLAYARMVNRRSK